MAYRVARPTFAVRLERQVRRYQSKSAARGQDEQAICAYRTRRGEMLRFEDAAKAAADRLGRVPVTRRFQLVSFARKLYAVGRRVEYRFWPGAMAGLAAREIRDGMDRDSIVAVVSVCWFLSSSRSAPGNLGELVDSEAVRIEEGVMSEESPKKTRPERVKREVADRDISTASQKTPLETYTRKRALESLRLALAIHQPIVKQCVLLRLVKQHSFEALAKELELSVEEVTDILSQMRVWVRRFTCYFENEWFWTQGGKKYVIPAPPTP